MLFSYFNRIFWDIYGTHAWDELQLQINRRMFKAVTGLLKERLVSSDETVLDTGCGTGNYAVSLAAEGFHVTGIDYSAGMLECARSKMTDELTKRLKFQQMDMNKPLEFGNSTFSAVISMTSLWTVKDPRFTLSEFIRVMKPGGTLLVTQVPKPNESLFKTASTRIKHLKTNSPFVMALVVVKAYIERTKLTKYWSPEELLALLLSTKQLDISYIDHGPPILVVATKISSPDWVC